jgi:hypothetical protein
MPDTAGQPNREPVTRTGHLTCNFSVELRDLNCLRQVFGGTTESQEEIIARGLGL